MQSKEACEACLEQALAHASPGSAHQAIQAEVVVGVKLGLHDIEGALCCGIQAHEAAHVIQGQAVLAVIAHIRQHLTEGHHTCAADVCLLTQEGKYHVARPSLASMIRLFPPFLKREYNALASQLLREGDCNAAECH